MSIQNYSVANKSDNTKGRPGLEEGQAGEG